VLASMQHVCPFASMQLASMQLASMQMRMSDCNPTL